MSKKRVHELAKDLGLDNNEALHALQAAGIAAKTHSSSVYEDEALRVLSKLKAPAAEPVSAAPKRPGMMIVKKKAVTESVVEDVVLSQPSVSVSQESPSVPSVEVPSFAQEVSVSEPSEVAGSYAATVSETAPSLSVREPEPPVAEVSFSEQPVLEPKVVQQQNVASEVSVSLDSKQDPMEQERKQVVSSHQPQKPSVGYTREGAGSHQQRSGHGSSRPHGSSHTSGPSKPGDRQHGRPQGGGHAYGQQSHGGGASSRPSSSSVPGQGAGGPSSVQPPVSAAGQPAKPRTSPTATVVRMIDREKLMERVPGRRLGGGQGGPGGGGPRTHHAGGGAPHQDRRPGGGGGYQGGRPPQDRRPGGGYGGGASRPGGPGGPGGGGAPRFGQVTELRMMPPDPFGRGGLPAGGRDKKGKQGGGRGTSANASAAPAKKNRTSPKKEVSDDMRERTLQPARLRKKKTGKLLVRRTEVTTPRASKRVIKMKDTIVVSEFAHQLGVKAVDVIRKLMGLGMMITQNQTIDFDTAQLIAAEYEFTVESTAFAEQEVLDAGVDKAVVEAEENQQTRPPVVTVMGHVDHGKTSLLDAIRKARVAAGEAGGITQHIGAYSVDVPGGKGTVTFLDTPGHAAFTHMRARGAQVTDIVVLVVAADDGVMPQTEEAIKHAQAAKVPIIVAVNKIDKPDANADRVMQELSKFSLLSEAWGGETLFVNTSATKGTGISELLEAIVLQAEVLELKANPTRPGVGVVVEAQLDKGRGPVATVLVEQGTFKRGDAVVVGEFAGKIRMMLNDQGKPVDQAGPSAPVEIVGLEGVPSAGDKIHAVESAEAAREVASHRQNQKRAQEQTSAAPGMSLDDLMKRMSAGEQLELKIVLKADVQGSAEALEAALVKLSTPEVKVNVIYAGVGGVKESDITLAAASRGIVLGFNVRPDANARIIAEREGVDIRSYNIIYEALDEIKKAMEGLLAPESQEKILGQAEVRELFRITKVGVIAGCRVTSGKVMRSAKVRVLRDSVQIYEGKPSSLRHFKNDVREVDAGAECGIGVEGFNDLKLGDVLEFFNIQEVARTLGSAPSSRKGGFSAHP